MVLYLHSPTRLYDVRMNYTFLCFTAPKSVHNKEDIDIPAPQIYFSSAGLSRFRYTGCPTSYQTRQFFNNFTTDTYRHYFTTDTFLLISHTANVLLFKSRFNIFIGFGIIKELPGLVGSGTPYTVKPVLNGLSRDQKIFPLKAVSA